MLRHLVRQGPAVAWRQLSAAGDRLPGRDRRSAAGGRMPPRNCLPRKQVVPAKRSLRSSWVICAVTIGRPGGRKINSPRSAVLRHKAKYEEQVVYARARPGGDEAEPAHSHLGCVRGVITQLRSCVNTEANIPIGVAGASRCGHYCLNGPRPPRNSAGWAVIALTATAFPGRNGRAVFASGSSRRRSLR